MAQHILVDEKEVDYYLLGGWQWNAGKYGLQRGLRELVDQLNKARSALYEFCYY